MHRIKPIGLGSQGTVQKWRRALELGGVVFIEPNPMGGDDLGPGVRLRSVKGKR
jgi:hypothetical protein